MTNLIAASRYLCERVAGSRVIIYHGVERLKQELNMPKSGSEMLKKANIYKTYALLKE